MHIYRIVNIKIGDGSSRRISVCGISVLPEYYMLWRQKVNQEFYGTRWLRVHISDLMMEVGWCTNMSSVIKIELRQMLAFSPVYLKTESWEQATS